MTAKLSPEFRLFVSHVHEETKLAEVVKHDLEDAFAERLTVFVSSLARDNPGGEEWEGKIREELRNPQLRMLGARTLDICRDGRCLDSGHAGFSFMPFGSASHYASAPHARFWRRRVVGR